MGQKERLLEIKKISFFYEQGKPALKDVSLSIDKGEKIAVLGANGAGKSTFFLTINGVRVPQEGKIFYRGEEIGKKNRKILAEHIGIVFQEADNQIIGSTVKSEVAFGPINQGLSIKKVEEQTIGAMREMGIEEWGDRPPHYLSGGEKKRVTIADILAMMPEIIVFDEPTASLDPVNVDMFEQVAMRLSKEGKTVLVSTHNVDFAYRFAERILVFAEGQLLADGNSNDIFSNQELLQKNHLKKPIILEIYELLKQKGKLASGIMPKTLVELEALLL
ncbi:MAG: ABC transporter ATP-binding protein [Lachnospiraceae bacterium]|nr:ABC transporter ATP-binding protein [Lachnospiraceae bacterium]